MAKNTSIEALYFRVFRGRKTLVQMFDLHVREFRTFDLICASHEAGEIIGHNFLLNGFGLRKRKINDSTEK